MVPALPPGTYEVRAALAGFKPQVQLPQDHGFEMRDHVARTQAAAGRGQPLDHAGGEVEGVDVAAEGGGDPRPQHLDRDLGPRVGAACAVDLCDRGGGDGFREVGKQRLDRGAQVFLHLKARDLGREGGQAVLQHPELPRHLGPHHVGAGRKDLAELDIGRAQRGDRAGDRRQGGVALVAEPGEGPGQRAGRQPHPGRRVHR